MNSSETPGQACKRVRGFAWILFSLLIVLTVVRIAFLTQPFLESGWDLKTFYDFRLWRTGVERYVATGQLYDTDTPGYFLAGSHSFYKYPPTIAAVLRPFAGQPQWKVGRIFLIANFVVLLSSLVLILIAFRPGRLRALCMVLLFLHWSPTWESLSDLRMEPLVLALFSASIFCLQRGKRIAAGVPVGVAGALIVFPWFVLVYFALRREWRVLLGALCGAIGALGVTAVILPARLTVQFFTEILPHLGGTSLSYENVGLLANLARLELLLTGHLPPVMVLDRLHLEGHVNSHLLWAHLVAVVVLIPILVLLYRLTAGAIRRASSLPVFRREPLAFGITVCLLALLIPSSWLSYQILLGLPLLCAVALAPAPRDDLLTWALLAFSAVVGSAIYGYTAFFYTHTEISSVLRSLIPITLWIAQIRVLRARAVRCGPFEASGDVPDLVKV